MHCAVTDSPIEPCIAVMYRVLKEIQIWKKNKKLWRMQDRKCCALEQHSKRAEGWWDKINQSTLIDMKYFTWQKLKIPLSLRYWSDWSVMKSVMWFLVLRILILKSSPIYKIQRSVHSIYAHSTLPLWLHIALGHCNIWDLAWQIAYNYNERRFAHPFAVQMSSFFPKSTAVCSRPIFPFLRENLSSCWPWTYLSQRIHHFENNSKKLVHGKSLSIITQLTVKRQLHCVKRKDSS